ncbi:hypothetical protein OIDMADRAFT_36216 [Oidiodendron maius Zn]|uniref:Uncharacterized protein n=1 Tax=Oidiodendron maius (strain Zn) TaxID=913774 RepID=A0A0C3GR68_OIDMZ|nr:hypothetical protein OIDMADRAFT_36216 [Oidiodendron maius Zn]
MNMTKIISVAMLVAFGSMVSAEQLNAYSDTNCQDYIATYYGRAVGQAQNVPTFYSFRGVGMEKSGSYLATNDGGCNTANGKYYTGTGHATGTTECHGYGGGFNCIAKELYCDGTTCD